MTRDRRLQVALALNALVVVAQLVAGVLASSLGLLADAGHDLTDVGAVGVALAAVRLARRPATPERTFGWHRSSILAAQGNAAGILAITALLTFEGIRRLLHPHHVAGATVAGVAAGVAAVNALAALVVHGDHADRAGHARDLSMRATVLHLAGDAVASLGVAAAGGIIAVTGRHDWLDPAASLVIGLLIAVRAVGLLREANGILLEGTPAHVEVRALTAALLADGDVTDVHDLHVWSLSSEHHALSAHLVLSGHPTLEQAQVVGDRVKRRLSGLGIAHATLELECETCLDDADAQPCAIDPRPATEVSAPGPR